MKEEKRVKAIAAGATGTNGEGVLDERLKSAKVEKVLIVGFDAR